jgi:hypothetical protein
VISWTVWEARVIARVFRVARGLVICVWYHRRIICWFFEIFGAMIVCFWELVRVRERGIDIEQVLKVVVVIVRRRQIFLRELRFRFIIGFIFERWRAAVRPSIKERAGLVG